jgi:hypothetical protein
MLLPPVDMMLLRTRQQSRKGLIQRLKCKRFSRRTKVMIKWINKIHRLTNRKNSD